MKFDMGPYKTQEEAQKASDEHGLFAMTTPAIEIPEDYTLFNGVMSEPEPKNMILPVPNREPEGPKQSVFVVEHKTSDLNKEFGGVESVIVHVASTMVMAVEWCKSKLEVEARLPDRPWWYVITEQLIDSRRHPPSHKIIDWNGQEMDYQPADGYK